MNGTELIWRKAVLLVGGWEGEMYGGSVVVERMSFGDGWGCREGKGGISGLEKL